jgi:hypothetical protein
LTGLTVLPNGMFQLSFANTTGANLSIRGTNVLTAPISTWPVVGHPTETSPGQYQFTDSQSISNSRRFYILVSP